MHSHGNIHVNCTFLVSCSFHFFKFWLYSRQRNRRNNLVLFCFICTDVLLLSRARLLRSKTGLCMRISPKCGASLRATDVWVWHNLSTYFDIKKKHKKSAPKI
jgi:hypothetical protein